MTGRDDELLEAAKAARRNAHAPYSRFQVGAAILADNGRIYAGANVENASFPEGQCAETTAIGAMVTDGGRRIEEILVLGSRPCTPCGGCRQRIREFAHAGTVIAVAGEDGVIRRFTAEEMLPAAFDFDAPR